MKTALTFLFVLFLCGPAAAQELPDDILADQYLLAATAALQKQDRQAAISAFQKIEALDVTPPAEFFYFYGKVLVENGVATSNVPSIEKGQSLLKKYVVASGREAEHYHSALEVLNMAEGPVEAAKAAQRRQREAAKRRQREEAEREARARRQREETARRQREEAEREAQRIAKLQERLPEFLTQVNAQMVRVPGGTFTMGCKDGFFRRNRDCSGREKAAHRVRVSSFEISKYEVTQELWAAVMGENPSHFQDCPQCPVERVSWGDVQAFLQKLNAAGGRYRLPSEAEWEYAARGGQESRGYEYAGSDTPDAVAWYEENSGERPHPVGQKQANELGLYDLSGNVWEWVQDCWNETYQGAPSDGRAWERGDCGRRVQRGGSWFYTPRYLRSAYRAWYIDDYRYSFSGFRIARSLP